MQPSRARVNRVQEDLRIRVEDMTDDATEVGVAEDPRAVWGSLFREHRDQLLQARQVGHNQYPAEEINRRAEAYANEAMRLAFRMRR